MSPGQAATRLRTLPEILKRERQNALRRVVRVAQRDAAARLRSSGIGRALTAKGARLVVKTQRVRTSADGSMRTGLELKGLAALVESGGQTRPHPIAPKLASVLRLRLPGGFAFARAVRHPGSRIPAQPYGRPALQAVAPTLAGEMEKAHQASVQKFEGR